MVDYNKITIEFIVLNQKVYSKQKINIKIEEL